MESVDCAGAIRVRNKLVDVASPRLLRVVAHCWLESCQDGGEEGWRRRRGTGLQHVVSLLLSETERMKKATLLTLSTVTCYRERNCFRSSIFIQCFYPRRYLGKQPSMSSSPWQSMWTTSIVRLSPHWNSEGSSVMERQMSSSWTLVSSSSWDTSC